MNKTQLIDSVSEIAGLTKTEAQRAVDAMLDSIIKTLSQGEQVALLGFGTFGVKKRAARTGRDPRTGGVLQIPAATVANFKAGKVLKDAVNSGVFKGEEEKA